MMESRLSHSPHCSVVEETIEERTGTVNEMGILSQAQMYCT